MAVMDLFSKRQSLSRGEVSDTYQYTLLPSSLRVQIVYNISDAMGNRNQFLSKTHVKNAYKVVVNTLCREYGVFKLVASVSGDDAYKQVEQFILGETDVERVMDAVELCCRVINNFTTKYDYLDRRGEQIAEGAISEINERFKQHGVGYQFHDGEIIRVDSQLIHAEVVKPALVLLNGAIYAGPQQEYLSAHEHYRHGRNKEALVDCLKAFESTMKVVCGKRQWVVDPKATAKDLIKTCLQNGLIPSYWETQFGALRTSLESAVPTGRNRLAGHGQGGAPVEVPNSLTGYMLHMTASTLLFLMQAEQELP